jgi:hypothetical protein
MAYVGFGSIGMQQAISRQTVTTSRLLKKGFVGKGEGNRDVNSGDIHRNWKT